jgi:hypothetical protein
MHIGGIPRVAVGSRVIVAVAAVLALVGSVTTVSAPLRPGYQAAKAQWIGDGLVVGGALQNTALALAVADLQRGEKTRSGDTSGYQVAIAAIEDFEHLPITDVTRAQDAEAGRDFKKVNTFFDLSRLPWSGICGASGPQGMAAAMNWLKEPVGTSFGVIPGPLRTAAADLQEAMNVSPTANKYCYPAVIADLEALESASKADIERCFRNSPGRGQEASGLDDAEIVYVDYFFTDDGESTENYFRLLGGNCQ